MPKVYIVNGSSQYRRMFLDADWELAKGPLKADMIQFTGGEDVSPCLYGEERHPYTGDNLERDLYEAGFFAFAQRMGIPMSGICRGGQFLNVMSGGRMFQHVEKHATGDNHDLVDLLTARIISVSSTHHQMMIPADHAQGIAFARLGGNKEVYPAAQLRMGKDEPDAEVLYYPRTKALCFQPHPEFFEPGHECFDYYFELIERVHGLRA